MEKIEFYLKLYENLKIRFQDFWKFHQKYNANNTQQVKNDGEFDGDTTKITRWFLEGF